MGVFKRTVKRGKKFIKKRYGLNKRSSGIKSGAIARDAMALAKMASMLNAEKKFFQYPTNNFVLGQVSINVSGVYALDMTPYITQGTDASTRNGNSIKLTTSMFQFQFLQQANTVTDMRIIVDIIHITGVPQTTFTASSISNIYDPGVFSGVIDYFSPRNQNHFSDYKVIRSFKVHLKADTVSPESTITSVQKPHKWNRGKGHHIRYQGNSGAVADVANGQIIMVFRADTGNSSATNSSLGGIWNQGAQTGCQVYWNFKHYFYDN